MHCCALIFIVLLAGWGGGPSIAQSGPITPGTYNVRTYGAKGDSLTVDTHAIQGAIDACGKARGTVLFPPGCYLSGTIELRSGVTLHLMRGSVLKGSPDLNDYIEKIPSVRS